MFSLFLFFPKIIHISVQATRHIIVCIVLCGICEPEILCIIVRKEIANFFGYHTFTLLSTACNGLNRIAHTIKFDMPCIMSVGIPATHQDTAVSVPNAIK